MCKSWAMTIQSHCHQIQQTKKMRLEKKEGCLGCFFQAFERVVVLFQGATEFRIIALQSFNSDGGFNKPVETQKTDPQKLVVPLV